MRDELMNALSELAWQYEQAIERESAAHPVSAPRSVCPACQARTPARAMDGSTAEGRATTVALLARQVEGAEALIERVAQALVLPAVQDG